MARKRKTKREKLQAQAYEAATTWHKGLGLTFLGVDLGACMEFRLMEALVSRARRVMERRDG